MTPKQSRILASRSQFPLKLSCAMTIHRSQGMTLNYLEIDCYSIFFLKINYSRARRQTYDIMGLGMGCPSHPYVHQGAFRTIRHKFAYFMNKGLTELKIFEIKNNVICCHNYWKYYHALYIASRYVRRTTQKRKYIVCATHNTDHAAEIETCACRRREMLIDYLPINAWFWGYYALKVLLWEV